MPPKFSLQSVLDYRHHRVEILEVELGRVLQAQKRCQTILETLQASHGRLLEQLGHHQRGDIDLIMIAQLRSNIKAVKERIVQQRARLLELSEQVRAKREETITAKQDKEALAKLKEKEEERYREEQAQRELRLQDDIYIARAFHRSTNLV